MPSTHQNAQDAQTQTVRIERMSNGPCAIAHLDSGKVAFVMDAVPGDTCEIRIVSQRKSYCQAEVVKVLEPSEFRVDPKVKGLNAIEAPWCHIAYDLQLEAKRENVISALVGNAHLARALAENVVGPVAPSSEIWGYRNKIELAACTDDKGKFALGIHGGQDKQVVAVARSPLGNRLIADSPKALSGAIRYLQGSSDLGIFRVSVRGSIRTSSVEVALWTPPSAFPRGFATKVIKEAVDATSIVRVLAEPGAARKVKRVEVLDGSGYWEESLSAFGESFLLTASAPSFFQVNTPQAERLIATVLEMLGIPTDATDAAEDAVSQVADLYSGVGTFSIPLSAAGADVSAIELSGPATRDLRRNCDINGCYVDVICDDVALAFKDISSSEGSLDAILVDPPRAGLERGALQQIIDESPNAIIYVSCDQQTMARDAQAIIASGYELQKVSCVDMFPQTPHVETVSCFRL